MEFSLQAAAFSTEAHPAKVSRLKPKSTVRKVVNSVSAFIHVAFRCFYEIALSPVE